MHVGVLRFSLIIPHARTLKDGRAVVQRVRDRIRHRFDVAVSEVDPSEAAGRRVLGVSTVGDEPRLIRSVLDKIVAFVGQDGDAILGEVDVEVYKWHPPGIVAAMPRRDG